FNVSLEETLVKYAKYSVENGYVLQTLYECFGEGDGMLMPSWVPKWHSVNGGLAQGWKMAGKPAKISFDESGNTVIVEGCIIDYVVKAVASFQQIEHEPLVLPEDFFFHTY